MNTIINRFAASLSSIEHTIDLGNQALVVLPDQIGICDIATKHFSGVTVALPSRTTRAHLIEAVRIGHGALAATLNSIQALAGAGPGPSRRRLMDTAFDHLSDFGTVLNGCRATDTDNWLFPLQGRINAVIENIRGQEKELLPVPLDHYGLEMWAERGAIYLIDHQNKLRNEHVIPLRFGTALVDIAASLKTSPMALTLLALLEIEKHSEWSHDLTVLIEDVAERLAADITNRALKRLTPDAAPRE